MSNFSNYFIDSFLFTHIEGSSPEICVSQNIFSEVLIKMFSAL